MFRDRASIRAMVCSAVEMVLPPGVFITTMPCRVAACGVDVVDADAGPGDGPQPRVALQGVGGDFHAAAADGAVGLGQGVVQIVALQPGADFHFHIPGRPQQGQTSSDKGRER